MPKDNSPVSFAKMERAVVVAPAGCGKTELIVRSVGCCNGRQLILTHTHAGKESLKNRLNKLKISYSRYFLETIHSFALRFSAAYPITSSINNIKPTTSQDYDDVISSATRLMHTSFVKNVLQNSYSGVFVDEYQDCTVEQHELIKALVSILPCRIVGDPLQGIYDFGGNEIIDFDRDVFTNFEKLPDLDEPWRWKDKNPDLGYWLLNEVRPKLMKNQAIKINEEDSFVKWIQAKPNLSSALFPLITDEHSAYILSEPVNVNKPHSIASKLKNRVRTIEPITSTELTEFAVECEDGDGMKLLELCLLFAFKCLTKIKNDCKDIFDNLDKGKNYRVNRKKKLYSICNEIINTSEFSSILKLYQFLEEEYKPTIKRFQLWTEIKKALKEVCLCGDRCLLDVIWDIRHNDKYKRRYIPKRCASRTVLLKGLECDHAIILDADDFDAKNLYVALTRPSTILTIFSTNRIIVPQNMRPRCPKCNDLMVIREVRNGKYKGKNFWGCPSYPGCNGVRWEKIIAQ